MWNLFKKKPKTKVIKKSKWVRVTQYAETVNVYKGQITVKMASGETHTLSVVGRVWHDEVNSYYVDYCFENPLQNLGEWVKVRENYHNITSFPGGLISVATHEPSLDWTMGAHKVDNTNLHLALGHIESITWIRSSVQDHFVDITRLKIEHETRETEHEA